ncbi:MAG: hypothetical protein ACOX8Q_08440 [Christensenellales bacterium]|jgi:putative membrane protein
MKFKRIALLALSMIILWYICAPSALALEKSKNETVYTKLHHDGSVDQIYVVNQLFGDYTDYGEYTDIKNLSTTSDPTISGDKITFPDAYVKGGLFYQGTAQGELPMTFKIKYYIDGKSILAQDLAGESGRLKIEINYGVNVNCDERIRNGYMAQISLTINLNKASNINAYDATTVITGSTLNVVGTVLPGKSGSMCLDADVSDFEMDAITITLLKGTFSTTDIKNSIDKIDDGFDDMIDGAQEMVEGTSELKDGVISLRNGVDDIDDGIAAIASAGEDMLQGINVYSSGLQEYTNSVIYVASGSFDFLAGLEKLSESGSAMAQGVSETADGLRGLSSSNADLKSLAESLLTSSDPSVQFLAQGTIQTLDALSGVSVGLDQASEGVSQYTAGVQQAAEEFQEYCSGVNLIAANSQQINAGYSEIMGGFDSYLAGIKSSASGIHRLYRSIKGLPGNIQELINGQIAFKEGITEAKDDISAQTKSFISDDSPSVSFASPGKNHPNSVQYIMMTPAISVPTKANPINKSEESQDFFTRLIDLFR